MAVSSRLLWAQWGTVTIEAEKMLALKEERIQRQTGTSQLVRGGFLGKTVCQTPYHSGRKQVQEDKCQFKRGRNGRIIIRVSMIFLHSTRQNSSMWEIEIGSGWYKQKGHLLKRYWITCVNCQEFGSTRLWKWTGAERCWASRTTLNPTTLSGSGHKYPLAVSAITLSNQ